MRSWIEGGGWWSLLLPGILVIGAAIAWRTARTRRFPIPFAIWVVTGLCAAICVVAPVEVCATTCSATTWLAQKLGLLTGLLVPLGLWFVAGAVVVSVRRAISSGFFRPT
jgi:hypothetical protein